MVERRNHYLCLAVDYSRPGLVSGDTNVQLIKLAEDISRRNEAVLPAIGPNHTAAQIEAENKEWWPTHREAPRQGRGDILTAEYRDDLAYLRQDGPYRLFLGAGSMGTSKLLAEAKGRNTLPKLNEFVGKNWGNNGDTFATRYVSTRTNPGQGRTAFIVIKHADNPILPASFIVYPEWDVPEGTLTSLAMTLRTELGEYTYDPVSKRERLHWKQDADGNAKMLEAVNLTHKMLNDTSSYYSRHEGSLNFTGHFHRPVNGFPESRG